jgi:hypothetical protein
MRNRQAISIVEAQLLAAQYFNMQLPLTLKDLVQAFRAERNKSHPDKNLGREKEAEEKFKVVTDAYSRLVTCAEAFTEISPLTTVEGYVVSELGRGLENKMLNGTDCTQCQRRGYTISFETEFLTCTTCKGMGRVQMTVSVRCRECNGTTQFKQRNGRLVDCTRCHKTGKISKPRHPSPQEILDEIDKCRMCTHGHIRRTNFDKPTYHICRSCEGVGEIRIFNPVIPKGRLAS